METKSDLEKPFTIRAYFKTELALLYNPSDDPDGSRRTLIRWIANIPSLTEELEAMGYNKFRKSFTPREVEAIVRHLGVP